MKAVSNDEPLISKEAVKREIKGRTVKFITEYVIKQLTEGKSVEEAREIGERIHERIKLKTRAMDIEKELKKALERKLSNKEYMQKASETDYAVRMHELFRGNREFFSYYNKFPKNEEDKPYKPAYFLGLTPNEFRIHLSGERSITSVPIDIDNKSYFGAIDIDRKPTKEEPKPEPVDIEELNGKIEKAGLPLVVCRSKGGTGVHAYIFCKGGVESGSLRALLNQYKRKLRLNKGDEIFPKQARIKKGSVGSTLNMPYYNMTERVCYKGGEALSIGEFLDLAYEKRQTREQIIKSLSKGKVEDLSEAPPCLERLIPEPENYSVSTSRRRNNLLFSGSLYFGRKFEDNNELYEAQVNTLAGRFAEKLSAKEIESTSRSAWERKDSHNYLCNQLPLNDEKLCDKAECERRKYGIRYKEPVRIKKKSKAEQASEERAGQFQECYELVSEFKIVRFNSEDTSQDEYEFKYNNKQTESIEMKVLMEARKLNHILARYSSLIFPVPTVREQTGYSRFWSGQIEKAEESGMIREIAEELTDEGLIRLSIKEYIELEDEEIKEVEEEPTNIESRGVFFRDRLISNKKERGDYFICKARVLKEILLNQGEIDAKKIEKYSTGKLLKILCRYKATSEKVNIKNSAGKYKQYRVCVFPLKAGTRCLKYGKSNELLIERIVA